ncbi:PREDICTED: NMDA receptor synaptonuclear signaling and neuronal migration factor [Myotis davidii]|uniref:NMDA receptor synaptonuclear signaling and neuronal migration factor n=1 Tax=Myotis davidii TaxID=225400 RepID=UPI000767802A|nr:PREDICTED: NMDA receptor synaptonuclear signaling and neuronal migration factor [Myotis davidii]
MATGLLAPPGLAPLSLGASWPGEGRSWHWAHDGRGWVGRGRAVPGPHPATHPRCFLPLSTSRRGGEASGWGSPGASPPDHLLADAYSGHEGSPEMQPAPQNKRRLSLVSNVAPGPSPRACGLDQRPLPQASSRRKKLERMYSVDRVSGEGLGTGPGQGEAGGTLCQGLCPGRPTAPVLSPLSPCLSLCPWPKAVLTPRFPRVFRGYAERKRRKRESDSASVIQRNFRKHLRMVGSRRVKAQSGDLQSSHCTLGEAFEDLDWEAEKGLEAVACDAEGFLPPKVMLISSKVPRAEYIPTIIRRDDPSIIPILYDHEHATFEDILEEIEKKLNIYHKGAKIWKMLIFCQGGPGHLYLLKNKVATFAKVEKEEDMIHFWKRLSRLMSKVNPEPNIIHIMGCYILGNPNGEKLFQNLRTLMTPYRVIFESPLELSAQGELVRLLPRTGMGSRGSAPFPEAGPISDGGHFCECVPAPES